MLAHMVYFTLKDDSQAAREKLLEDCNTYLKDQPGIVFFAAGILVKDLSRPVNVRDFHVGLHVVFADRKSHDDYQTSQQHLQFIEENKDNWEKVRVFDTNAS